jgi:iron complex transport system substrate-binding protein
MTQSCIKNSLIALGVLLCAGLVQAVTLTDDRGTPVRVDRAPQRIVSLLPSLTETVCALGACARLVGTDRYSNSPASVQLLPKVGGGLDPNIEAIVALKPDLVLAASSCPAVDRLRSLGLTVVALEPKSHADVERVLMQVGDIVQGADPRQAWQAIDAEMNRIARSLPPSVRALRVYFEVNSAPYAAGEASFIGETLTRLGAQNIVPVTMGAFPKLNPEVVVRANPDLIMMGEREPQALGSRPGWSRLRAVRENRICRFTESQSDVLVRAGPRMAEGARIMAQCLNNFAP